jgi:signal transduction histidine kinase
MSLLVIAWSMFSAACILLGLIQLFLLSYDRREKIYLLSAVMAFGAAVVALLEMNMFSTPDPVRYQHLLLWENLAISLVLVPMVWSVQAHIPSARTWIAVLITALWVCGLLVNFLLPGNLTFVEVHSIDQKVTPWGDLFYVPNSTTNDWKWLVDATVILIPIYLFDAAWSVRHRNEGKNGVIITIGALLFILFAGGESILVDHGILKAPYMISVAFLSLILSWTWVLARDAVRTRMMALEVTKAHHETERMMRANLLGEVASALAHELNQPLSAILGNAQAAQKFLDRPEPELDEVREILADIVRDDKRAGHIIRNLRQMLKGDESLHTLVDLESVIRESLALMSKKFNEQQITVRFKKSGHTPDVRGGRIALQQVFLNLLVNAKHALLETRTSDREIRLYLRENNGGAEVEICDSGPGIADDVRSRIFDPFVTTKTGHLGMGLAICRRIVEAQGGKLTAENADGGGACFRVWLPGGA